MARGYLRFLFQSKEFRGFCHGFKCRREAALGNAYTTLWMGVTDLRTKRYCERRVRYRLKSGQA